MLILFDVDATLITTSRAGIRAMGDAGRELYGDDFDESRVEYAGRLDPLIIADLLGVHGQATDSQGVEAFRAGYGRHLKAILTDRSLARPCPGIPALLDALEGDARVTLGLLTGNYPETGGIKIAAAGIDIERFTMRVWGCDSPHDPPARDHLTEVALKCFGELKGCNVEPNRVTIIGDTPYDIGCAHAHGCRAIGVATGSYSREDLERAGADLALGDLSDAAEVVDWLMRGAQAPA